MFMEISRPDLDSRCRWRMEQGNERKSNRKGCATAIPATPRKKMCTPNMPPKKLVEIGRYHYTTLEHVTT